MSSIRSFVEILRRIWRLLEIKVRKYGVVPGMARFENLLGDVMSVDVLKLYD